MFGRSTKSVLVVIFRTCQKCHDNFYHDKDEDISNHVLKKELCHKNWQK